MSDTRNPFGRALFATVLLSGLLSSFLGAQGRVNVTPLGQADARIQLDRWVDTANGIDNPLTEIVEIIKGDLAGKDNPKFCNDCVGVASSLVRGFGAQRWRVRD